MTVGLKARLILLQKGTISTMADFEGAKKTALFFAGTTGNAHFVVDNNKEGSVDKFIPLGLEKLLFSKVSLDDKRIVFSSQPVEEVKAALAKASKPAAKSIESGDKAPAAKAAPKAATKAPAAKQAVAVAATPIKSEFVMVSVHNDQYNWFLDHGLTVPQGLLIAQKYHASIEKQKPGLGDETLQKLTAPKPE